MKNLRRVLWSRGMFLTPQHFQTLDNLVDDILQFRFAASHFANWGIVNLDIDRESLANGIFRLRKCSGILPDGTVFSTPDSDPPPGSRPIEKHFAPSQNSLDVFLALPERRVTGRNFTQTGEVKDPMAVTTRYIAEKVEVVDENGFDEAKSLQVGTKNLKLIFENQNLDGFVAIRIARIVRNQSGAYMLDSGFIAPSLSIESSECLMSLLRREIEILISKSESLNSNRRQRGASLADFNASESATFWLLHTVNSRIPELQHIWTAARGHPERLWVAMLQLAGGLATFSLEPGARDLPSYDHSNLGACFAALDEKIRGLLETVIPSKCFSIPLRLLERSIWTGTISSDEFFKNSSFFLAISAKMPLDELINKVPLLVKISPADEIQNLKSLALPGVALRHAQTTPNTITFKQGNQYFVVNQMDVLWHRIAQSRGLSIYVPPEIADAQIELLVVLE